MRRSSSSEKTIMIQPLTVRRFAQVLLLAAAAAACGQDARELPTASPAGPRAGADGLAPLLAAGADALPGRYIVVMNPGTGDMGASAALDVAALGGTVHHLYEAALDGFAATLTPEAVEALRRDPRVQYVAQDGVARMDQTTQPAAPWGLDRVDQRGRDGARGPRRAHGCGDDGARAHADPRGVDGRQHDGNLVHRQPVREHRRRVGRMGGRGERGRQRHGVHQHRAHGRARVRVPGKGLQRVRVLRLGRGPAPLAPLTRGG